MANRHLTKERVKELYELNPDTEAFTPNEKQKLADLISSKFLGSFVSLAALQTAYPAPPVGSYAHVDAGVGADVQVYIWDADDSAYVVQAGSGTEETAATIKTKYESNPDTNPFTDAEKTLVANAVQPAALRKFPGRTVTASTTLASTDAGQAVRTNMTTGNTVALPTDAADMIPADEFIQVAQHGSGTTSITAPAGVTLNGIDGGFFTFANQWDAVTVQKLDMPNAWVIYNATVSA